MFIVFEKLMKLFKFILYITSKQPVGYALRSNTMFMLLL